MTTRHAFVISDRTGLTAEAMAGSLLPQFPNITFITETLPFVDSAVRAAEVVLKINESAELSQAVPLVFVTIVDDEIRDIINTANSVIYDLFDTFIGPLEKELGAESSHSIGKSHGVKDTKAYTSRIGAVNFALQTDDGLETDHYNNADLIITGVSRCGKTPTSLYLSLHYGAYVSNYPLTDRELQTKRLPEVLIKHRAKVFGLTIDPIRLLQIRKERYKGESYSSSNACQQEVAQAENIFRTARIPYLNTTRMSVEEIGATIMHRTGLRKKL